MTFYHKRGCKSLMGFFLLSSLLFGLLPGSIWASNKEFNTTFDTNPGSKDRWCREYIRSPQVKLELERDNESLPTCGASSGNQR